MEKQILLVLTALVLKHFFADFPLQTVWMLGKGKKGTAWIMPLAAHAGVHALFTAMIFAVYRPECVLLALVDFGAHFVIDRMKASYRLPAGQWANEEKGKYLSKYYMAFGLDQMAHHLTYIALVYLSL